jgi:flavin reductase (DIM6/NTAB) family NADH-FMN oxidoreductase RutF
VDVVFGEVVRIHVRDDVVRPDGKLDIAKIRPIARMGYFDYAVIDGTFEMLMPDEAALAGLEGRAARDGG